MATAASHYHHAVLLPPTNDSVSRPTLSNPTAHRFPTTIANYGRRHRNCLPVKLSHLFAGAKHGAGAHIPPQPPSPDGRGAGDRNGSRRGFIIASTRLTASNKKNNKAHRNRLLTTFAISPQPQRSWKPQQPLNCFQTQRNWNGRHSSAPQLSVRQEAKGQSACSEQQPVQRKSKHCRHLTRPAAGATTLHAWHR